MCKVRKEQLFVLLKIIMHHITAYMHSVYESPEILTLQYISIYLSRADSSYIHVWTFLLNGTYRINALESGSQWDKCVFKILSHLL